MEDSSGTLIASDGDSGRKTNFRIICNIEPGTYFLNVYPYLRTGGRKKVYCSAATLEPGNYVLDVGGTRDTATPLALGTSYTDERLLYGTGDDPELDDIDDIDYFRIEVDQSGRLTVWTTGSTLILMVNWRIVPVKR